MARAGTGSVWRLVAVGLVLAATALVGCADEGAVRPAAAQPAYRDYCAKSLALETFPAPETDVGSLTSEQGRAANRAHAAKLVPLAEALRSAASAEARPDIDIVADAIRRMSQTGDFASSFAGPDVREADLRAHEFDLKNCGWARVDVVAREYSFTGVPPKLGSGPISFEVANHGDERHELVLFRVNDGVTTPVRDIVRRPADEAGAKITRLATVAVDPGAREHAVVDLKKGRYGVASFLPAGGGRDGPSDASKGMFAAVAVV